MTGATIDGAAYAELQDTVGDDFAAELLETFLAEAPVMLGELRSAAAANDTEAFRRAAHSIKSNATTFGATGLANLARHLELNGIDAAGIDGLAVEQARAESALRRLLDGC